MTVLLVRHGETTWNVERRVQGWAGTPLSGRGREQARATGAYLADLGVDRLVVSDLQRTQETARLFAEAGLDAQPAYEQGWRERDFGDLQGLGHAAAADRCPGHDPDASLTGVDDVPGGESLDDFRGRVLDTWEALVADHGGTTAVVTHGGPIRVVVAAVTDQSMATLARTWSPDNCGVTELAVAGDTTVERRDDTTHL